MGIADKAKDLLDEGAGRAKQVLADHEQQVHAGIDKAAGIADARTSGKHHDKIEGAAGKAKDALSKLAGTAGAAGTAGTTDPGTAGAPAPEVDPGAPPAAGETPPPPAPGA
jgi:hypothetical protein